MSDQSFTEQELNELRGIFFTEAYEILDQLNQGILDLESGHDRGSALKAIQRHLHTLKGNSRALGFTSLNHLTHTSEDLLKKIQETGQAPDQPLIDLLLTVHDEIRAALDGYRSNGEAPLPEALIARIDECLASPPVTGADGHGGNGAPQPAAQESYDVVIDFDARCEMRAPGARLIVDRLKAFGEVERVEPPLDGDGLDGAERFRLCFRTADTSVPLKELVDIPGIVQCADIRPHDAGEWAPVPQAKPEPQAATETVQSLRVEAQRVDKILNLVGELVIGRSMVSQALAEIEERYKKDDLVRRLGDANTFMEKTLSQLQKNVMKIRMLPIAQVFRKFPRVVRDLAAERGRQVELVMEGEKTELDKSILDVIGEPLIHLVRNAVDHGLESPDDRERGGKPRVGTVTLRAYHEGNQIVIDVIDDGRGLNYDRLRRKAVETGVKTQEEADRMTDAETGDLIFLPGFSTADVITDISGRGLGMDIVRTTVESLKGRIQVKSAAGAGTTVTLRLPLTLAIIRAMLFRAGGRLFALPLSTIERILRVRGNDLQTVNGREVLRFREKVISLVSLQDSFVPEGTLIGQGRKFVIVVGLGEKRYGFLVDRLVGQQELVIKALDNHWGTVNCTSGASILGNGKVVLILDAPALIAREMRREAAKG